MAKTKHPLTAVPAKIACERLGVSSDTLRRWHRQGLINAQRTAGNHMRYDLAQYLEVQAQWEAEQGDA